jgi:hypothetical protein
MAIHTQKKRTEAYFSVLFRLDENVLTLITTRKNTASTHYHEFYNLIYEKLH